MELCITPDELRKALTDIEQAEANGFMHCLSVFRVSSAGRMLDQCRMEYDSLIEKAHPTDGNLNWGRFQSVTRRNKFKGGKLIPLSE